MSATALLVRHCESTGQEPEAPLTERGRLQAARLAEALAPRGIASLVSSPYRRTRESGAPLARRTALEPVLDERLREWAVPWIAPEHWPDALRPVIDGAVPLPAEFESREAARARGVAVLREALARDGEAVLFTHGKLLALILSEVDGGGAFEHFRTLRQPHVFEVLASPTGLAVRELWTAA
jgi:2,3-bisphosphoglycerate-dependent phosphoglycerate mutase